MEITFTQLLERVGMIAVLAILMAWLVEAALDRLFTWSAVASRLSGFHIKMLISVAVSYVACCTMGFSALEVLYTAQLFSDTSLKFDGGQFLTALIVSRGSHWVASNFGELKTKLKEAAGN